MTAARKSLLEATRDALDAASAGDLAALEKALEARAGALDGAAPEERAEAFLQGQAVAALIHGFQQRLVFEHSRLEQVRSILRSSAGSAPRAASVDLRG